ncbi:hypothetical protein CYMTET_52323 [Cymbomonas tetramitiformis]|uniref:Uncharacterized protein n=1 Tax=Cymbomonas tetramitiformis TaxID=36881 RepID=A0AAE0BKE3_9CHLO|nr:hypothetical protein CYMTET_52323 [Cymbomonas tetramitiformis]
MPPCSHCTDQGCGHVARRLGYKFTTGSNGIYIGAQQLMIADLSGIFAVEREPVAGPPRVQFSLKGLAEDPGGGANVQLRVEHVGLKGEKGTNVPNATADEVTLDVAVLMEGVSEYTLHTGWVICKGFTFEVVRLDRSVTNGSIPLPNKLIKWLLNLLLPKLLKKHLTAVLLPELGTYFELVQEAVAVEGEFKITGPAVSMMDANLGKVSKDPLQAAALQQLKLSEEQGSAVASLFGTKLGLSRTKAKHVTISELCRYYSRYKPHRVAWAQLEALWEEAIKMHCKGASEPPTFPQLMREVKRLRRHPIKVHVALNTLHFGLNLDVGIRTLGRALSRLSKKSKEKKDGGSVRSGGSENASESASEAGEDEDTAHEAISKWQEEVLDLLASVRSNLRNLDCRLHAGTTPDRIEASANNISFVGPCSLIQCAIRSKEFKLLKKDAVWRVDVDPEGVFKVALMMVNPSESPRSDPQMPSARPYASETGGGTGNRREDAPASDGSVDGVGGVVPTNERAANSELIGSYDNRESTRQCTGDAVLHGSGPGATKEDMEESTRGATIAAAEQRSRPRRTSAVGDSWLALIAVQSVNLAIKVNLEALKSRYAQAQVDGADLNSMLADVLNVNFFFAPPEDDQERAAYMLDVACSGIAQVHVAVQSITASLKWAPGFKWVLRACESRGVVKQRQARAIEFILSKFLEHLQAGNMNVLVDLDTSVSIAAPSGDMYVHFSPVQDGYDDAHHHVASFEVGFLFMNMVKHLRKASKIVSGEIFSRSSRRS